MIGMQGRLELVLGVDVEFGVFLNWEVKLDMEK